MGVGQCWGSLRGPLRENFSFSDIKGDSQAQPGLRSIGLATLQQRQGQGGTSKGQLIDHLDLLFAEKRRRGVRTGSQRLRSARCCGARTPHGVGIWTISWQCRSRQLGQEVRDGEAYPVPPPGQSSGMNDPTNPLRGCSGCIRDRNRRSTRYRLRLGKPLHSALGRTRSRSRWVARSYQISGVAWGTRPAWDFISASGAKLTREQFLALPDSDRQAPADQVQAVSQLFGRPGSRRPYRSAGTYLRRRGGGWWLYRAAGRVEPNE